jgi:hypothetical protein
MVRVTEQSSKPNRPSSELYRFLSVLGEHVPFALSLITNTIEAQFGRVGHGGKAR